MQIIFHGHSCIEMEYNGKKLLFDPFITDNPLSSGVDINTLDPDYILISHSHGDHIADAEAIAKQSGAKIISNYEIVTWFNQEKGIEGHPMNHGGKFTFDFGTVKYVNAVHSSTMPDNTAGGNPGGFVVWGGEKVIYFAGDTALHMDMKLIPLICPPIDLAILPIGDNFTMGYDDASIAAEFVEAHKVMGCHFDTFGYIKIDHDAARTAFKKKNIDLILPNPGDKIEL